jgi:putative acetyltransferase
MTTLIRLETAADRSTVQQLITAAFAPAEADRRPVVEAVLNEQLRRHPSYRPDLSLVAELDGTVVAQLTSSNGTIRSEDDNSPPLPVVALGPVSVHPDHQHRGLGSALMRAVIDAAREAGEPVLVLLGSPAFYGRFGFVAASTVGIVAPDPLWAEHFQALPLRDASSVPIGVFRYPAPFEGL